MPQQASQSSSAPTPPPGYALDTPPPPPGYSLDSGTAQSSSTEKTAPPSFFDRFKDALKVSYGTTPLGVISEGAGHLQDWASKKYEDLTNPGKTPNPDARAVFGAGALRDTAGMIKGATSPEGSRDHSSDHRCTRNNGASPCRTRIVFRRERMGDISDPDVLQRELGAASEVAGGALLLVPRP